jgi:hypothetical protein
MRVKIEALTEAQIREIAMSAFYDGKGAIYFPNTTRLIPPAQKFVERCLAGNFENDEQAAITNAIIASL